MEYKVVSSQYISSMCAVCGQHNDWGFHGHFYNLENGDLYALLNPIPEHQSYPGRVHGGVLGAIIDECVGRAINSREDIATGKAEPRWGVTMHLNTKFRKPTPYEDGPLYCITHITKENRRVFEGVGYLYTADGTLCMEGEARYAFLSQEQICDAPLDEKDWFPDPTPVPETVEIPTYPKFKEPK